MNTEDSAKKVVDLLLENEKEMMHLYLEFSKKFVLYHDFWLGIAGEEESHAAWVNTLYGKIDSGVVQFSPSHFPIEAIEHNIEYMREVRKEAFEGEITLLQALETAVSMENNMLENKFFEVFKGDAVELQVILEALRLGTKEHLREIKRVWKKEKLGAEFEVEKA